MLDLLIVACLASSPKECFTVQAGRVLSQEACGQAGMIAAATWASEHPNWTIREVICRPASIPI